MRTEQKSCLICMAFMQFFSGCQSFFCGHLFQTVNKCGIYRTTSYALKLESESR